MTSRQDSIDTRPGGRADGPAPTATATAPTGSPTAPLTIHADRAGATLAIGWADGHATRYDFTALRWLCPCAYCRGEMGLPGWLDSAPTLTTEQTRMTDIHLVGNYAVSPHWADGHSTGFYTFNLLRDRCPCADCTTRRGATGHGHEDRQGARLEPPTSSSAATSSTEGVR
ncbi:MAG: hypothetical protein NVS9B8_02370 [Candidatus Limnocylindrales bacterium]